MKHLNFEALNKNIAYFKSVIGETKLCAVVKNDAYGHGLLHIATHIAPQVHCFGVGTLNEAEQISFLGKDVLILLPQSERAAKSAVLRNYILTLDSFDTLSRILGAAKQTNNIARVHIKIDSGMSRLGFTFDELPALAEKLQNQPVVVEGVFSHFYGNTVETCDAQFEYFMRCAAVLQKTFPDVLLHIANTSATLLSPKYHLDMVRIGLGLFGYGDNALTPVKSVCADVISVKSICAGAAVGYGGIYRPTKPTKIATVNIGYAHGLPRVLTGSKIAIKGKKYTVVAVCMAMTLVDIGDDDVRVGDVAVFLGEGVNISDDRVIIYELLCNLR